MEAIKATINLPKNVLFGMHVNEQNVEEFIKKNLAVELYREGVLSLGKAAELSGVRTRWEMMMILKDKHVPIDYPIDEVKKDVVILDSILKKRDDYSK